MVSLPPSEPDAGSAGSDLCRYASAELSLLNDGNLDARFGCEIGRRPPSLFAPPSMTEEATLDIQFLPVGALSLLAFYVFTVADQVDDVEGAKLLSYVERVPGTRNRVED